MVLTVVTPSFSFLEVGLCPTPRLELKPPTWHHGAKGVGDPQSSARPPRRRGHYGGRFAPCSFQLCQGKITILVPSLT